MNTKIPIIVHTRYIPDAPMGIIKMKPLSDEEIDRFRKAMKEMGRKPLLIVHDEPKSVKIIPLNKKNGRLPRATFIGIPKEFVKGTIDLHLGVAVCSERDQFRKSTGRELACDRAFRNGVVIKLANKDWDEAYREAFTIVKRLANNFYKNIDHWKGVACSQDAGKTSVELVVGVEGSLLEEK